MSTRKFNLFLFLLLWSSRAAIAQPPPEVVILTGRVLQMGTDEPITDAMIRLVARPEGGEPVGYAGGQAQTDANGEFTLKNVEEGRYSLSVFVRGYKPHQQTLKVIAGRNAPLLIRLERLPRIRGMVRAPNGVLLTGAELFLRMRCRNNLNQEQVTTDDQGRYEAVADQGPGEYGLLVIAPGVGYARADWLRLQDKDLEGVDLHLTPGASVNGEVRNKRTGEPIANLFVSLSERIRMILDGVYQAQTGEDGRFSFADLPGGTYWLSAYNQDYLYPPLQTLKLKEGETADPVVIELVEAVTVHGRLLDVDGKPMAGREIEFSGFIQAGATFQGWEIPRVTTEADGQFTLRANRLGLARLQVLLAGEGYAKAQFEIREGKNIEGLELRLRRFCRIVGTVRDRQANRPLPGILIRARTDQFRIYFLGWSGQAEATSDEAGRFEIGGLLPATYSIQVAARGYRLVSDPQVRLTEAEEVKEITVELERSTPVQRWVCRSDGQAPLVGAWVAVRSE